jgi:hypothetical protein
MALEEGGGFPPKDDGDNFFHPPIMNSVINETVPEIPLVLRKEIIRLCSLAAHDGEEKQIASDSSGYLAESWEVSYKNHPEEEIARWEGTKAGIEKFCELEGIKQEFKGPSYRLAGPWRKP